MTDFGVRLKKARKDKGLTQAELGNLTGFKKSAVSSWEAGTAEPNFQTIQLLCAALDVSVDYLMASNDKTIEDKRAEFNQLMTEKNGVYFRLAKGAKELGVCDEDVDFLLEFMKRGRQGN